MNIGRSQRAALGLCLLMLIPACESSRKSTDGSPAEPPVRTITVPAFNSDSAFHFIERQVAFGPRVPNSAGHRQCGDYLVEKLTSYGAEVTVQPFVETAYNGERLYLRNIIASFRPAAQKRILLAAHWDTRPFADKDPDRPEVPIDGANDGGSGVGVLLEVARVMHANETPDAGIDIIFFDGEDYGEHENIEEPPLRDGRMQIWWCLGSQYWAKNPHRPGYSAYYGILLDMVGARSARFYREGGSMQFAPKVVRKIWSIARSLGYSNFFIESDSPGIMDDHIFMSRDARIPTACIVEYDPESPAYYFGSYHHTHRDNLTLIDRQTLQAVGETVLYAIYHE
jgi:glutaminyl-peptide cyclotransferase